MPYSDPERQREYQRSWMAERRKDWIEANGPCVDCGTREDQQVDHADASTKVSHRVWSWSKQRREAELAKCVVRCGSCHQKKSVGEKLDEKRSGPAKLTAADVLAIRASQLSLRILADQFGVDYTLIWQIRKRKIWQHI